MSAKSKTKTEVSDVTYTVEDIMGKRVDSTGQTQYLVKWWNYHQRVSTWEPIHHFRANVYPKRFESGLKDVFEEDDDKYRLAIDEEELVTPKKVPTKTRKRKLTTLMMNICADFRKKGRKRLRKTSNYSLEELFGVEPTATRGETLPKPKLIGAAKRKAKPTPIDDTRSRTSDRSDRELRAMLRD